MGIDGCCAHAASGHGDPPTATSVMNCHVTLLWKVMSMQWKDDTTL
jgi:hypothetical protein